MKPKKTQKHLSKAHKIGTAARLEHHPFRTTLDYNKFRIPLFRQETPQTYSAYKGSVDLKPGCQLRRVPMFEPKRTSDLRQSENGVSEFAEFL